MTFLIRTFNIFCFLIFTISNLVCSQSMDRNSSMLIDSHIHLYDTDRVGSSIFLNPEKHQKIYNPHLAQDFLAAASPSGVNYAVVVEASKRREDNFWVMNVVDQSDNMLAFIGNLDPRDEHYVEDLETLSQSKKFRGIRIRPTKAFDFSNEQVIEQFNELDKRNLVLELRENHGPIEAIKKIASTFPTMNIIIDHMAGGRIQGNTIVPEGWKEKLIELATLPNVYVKISALYSLSGTSIAPTDYKYYQAFIDQVIDTIGPDRVLFGSNWTLSEMHGSYSNLIQVCNHYLKQKEQISPEKFYTENCIKAYGLEIVE